VYPYVIGWVQTAHEKTGAGELGLTASFVIGNTLVFSVPVALADLAKSKPGQ
jgi:ethanolamine transporter EutH